MGKVILSGIVEPLTKPSLVPPGYTKLEYIVSSGAQYIDTGFKPNQDTRTLVDVELPAQSSYPTALFGGRNGDTSRSDSYTVWLISATQFQTDFDTEAVKADITPVGRLVIDKDKAVTTINGSVYTNSAMTFQSNYNLGLMTQIDVGGPDTRITKGRLYSAKIWDNGTLIRDFIPCTNPEGVVGLWDRVEKKFYPSASTTAFYPPAPNGLPDYGTTLNDMTWEEVAKISSAGLASNYFAVGDTKTITINGKAGATTFSSLSINVFIIGIDHNASVEGTGVHFTLGQISSKNVALVDSSYNASTTSSGKFHMNTSSTNSGGWASSKMRKVVLGSDHAPIYTASNTLLAALPADLLEVLKLVTKYTNNNGGSSNTASYVTATKEAIPLLAEFEVFGSRSSANSAEQNYQQQYDYYKAGNSKVRYRHDSTGTTTIYWLRSPSVSTNQFCRVVTGGTLGSNNARYSYGVAPIFVVGEKVTGPVTFTIEKVDTNEKITCYAEEGMTWAEWCKSEFNIGNFSINVNGTAYVIHPGDSFYYLVNSSGDGELSTDIIVNGANYSYDIAV